jgi:hypothetical protein
VTGPIIVFAGPTLAETDRSADPRLDWRPPAQAGDAYAAGESGPVAVVLIDGLFDTYPAVRHKELLWLMAQGVPVWGAASMGALRAAELAAFGMRGVGRIFSAYAAGRLVRDDEVAVLHAPAAAEWAPLTEALVNVRATLAAATRLGIIDVAVARRLRRVAADLHFQDRTWPAILAQARERDAEALNRWLPEGRIDLKALDAAACVKAALAAPPAAATSQVSETVFTEGLARQVAEGLRSTPA